MQLGFVSAILGDCSLEEVFEFASSAGYSCVEVMCWPPSKAERRYAGVCHINTAELSDAEIRSIQGVIQRTGVQISGLGYYPNPLSPDREESQRVVSHLRTVISAASRLGLSRVNSFIGRDWKLSIEDNWPRFLETWPSVINHAEQHQVKIGIENCPMSFTQDEWPGGKNLAVSPAIWRKMFAEIPSPNFGLNYDPSHLIWQQIDYIRPIAEFASRLHHVHAKDARVDHDRLKDLGIFAYPNLWHTPKIPGMGEIEWGKFFGALADAGYDGPVCVEVEDRAFEHSLDARKYALRQSAAYLRQFVAD
jgi:sugar phosphate isomerase/epimerase